jgi:hypothetical protein
MSGKSFCRLANRDRLRRSSKLAGGVALLPRLLQE